MSTLFTDLTMMNMSTETTWSIDQSHSEIAFKVKHLMITHIKGTFGKFDADIITEGSDFTTVTIDLSIDANSISTGDIKRDEHLKGEEFFDVKKFRQIGFKSSKIGKEDESGSREFWGELTMKGITKAVKLSAMFGGFAKDPSGIEKAGFTVKGTVKRSDWGLNWNSALETGGFILGDDVVIACEIELSNNTVIKVRKPLLESSVLEEL
ncbi:MAG TPA: YceI family protein [Bacteroidia bacterium]|nr:YceI family protein [Bacteroidia bacterium]